ncbi:uncharacterized protein LOC116352190 [Contarinia nasturtii]|uniref:uncharacterized protein LOC116352190 n=1 Tax=Contarinia nasturtii TaxID=265458 RepID=UPI0012D44078|nr:uncharacterized protein LOC116352190 [Contarinia nasturtii]
MLWKKEYIDLRESHRSKLSHEDEYNINIQRHVKKDKTSISKRELGNMRFRNRDYVEAIEDYNDSLRFAESDRQISLAYANRASCFLHLKRYNECLTDIDLAKKAGYPAELMKKLDKREASCLEEMENAKQSTEFGAKLSFDPDEKFPCMANVLQIDKDKNNEFCVTAKEDIDVGKTVVVDEPFEKYIYRDYARKCNICLKGNTNLMPCKMCPLALFCSEECQKSDIHGYVCGMTCTSKAVLNGETLHLVRGILVAVKMFPNINDLIKFVEAARESNPKEIPSSIASLHSKYRAFLKLPIKSNEGSYEFLHRFILNYFMACDVLIEHIPKIVETFKSRNHRNFLTHLVWHHVLVTMSNIHRKRPWWLDESEDQTKFPPFYARTALMQPYFQRSCAPNVLYTDCDGNEVYITVRPIKKGQQLLISDLKFLVDKNDFEKNGFGEYLAPDHVTCTCMRCTGTTATKAELQQLESDPDFQSIEKGYKDLGQCFIDDKRVQAVIDKCIAFSRKYGEVFWSYEIRRAIELFMHITAIQLVNPLHEQGVYGAYYNI